jgi:hypothetical protein
MADPAQLAQQLEDLNREFDKLDASISGIASKLSGKLRLDDTLRKSVSQARDLTKAFADGEKVTKNIEKQLKASRDAIEKSILKEIELRAKGLKKAADNLAIQRQVLYQVDAQLRTLQRLNEEYQKQNNLFTLLGSKLKDFGKSIKEFFSIASIFKMLIDGALRFNKVSVDISKNLDYGADNANRVANEMVRMARSSDNINVTLANAAEAMSQLNAATGFNVELSRDALETQIMLTKQLGLSGEEAAVIYKLSLLTGKSSSQIEKAVSRAYVTNKNAFKVGTSYKEVISTISKTSGELAVSLGTNPDVLAKAVVQAKAFGTTLEKVKQQGDALLDFETSIENELKAELLTGEQLNLERARAAALAGDQVALAEELNNQGMTLAKFEKMNVLGRRAYAQALGLSSDELSDQLRKQKQAIESGKSLAQLTQEEADEAKKRQDIQTKFNQGIDKLKDTIGNLLAGPLGGFIDSLANGLVYVNKIFSIFGKMGDLISKWFGGKVGGFLGDVASIATIGGLVFMVSKSLTKGTLGNPMITKDIGSALGGGEGGSLTDMILGKKSGGRFKKGGGRVPKGGRTGGLLKGTGKLAKGAGLLSLLSAGVDLGTNLSDDNRSVGNALGKTLDQNKFTALGAGIGALFGGVGAVPGAAIGGLLDFALGDATQIVEDGIAGASRGPFTIIDSYGGIGKTSEGDSLLASPNVGGGGDNSSAVIAAINQLKDAIVNRPITINLDSRQVGSALVQSSYKSA